MYTDTLLFLISSLGVLIFAVCFFYLMISRKKSKKIKKIIKDEIKTEIKTENNSNETEMGTKTEDFIENEINTDIFKESYIIEKQIYSGPMSRVFAVKSIKLGNKWIIKFVPRGKGHLMDEHEKLKDLTHMSLPKIIDIFEDKTGIYIVESFIEGKNLKDVIKETGSFNKFLLIDWFKQLCDVYSYLHKLPKSPVYHLDIKPANIMVTHGNKLVPIDFGISKTANENLEIAAAFSPSYAAPEQFVYTNNSKYKNIMKLRFGDLPIDHIKWKPDARTDIFSLGTVLFELAAGEIPNTENISKIKNYISADFAKIILKCININPDKRYQSMDDISADLQKLKEPVKNLKISSVFHKTAVILSAVFLVFSSSCFLAGAYIYRKESLSNLKIEPDLITLSLQQSSEFKIEKKAPDGEITIINPNGIIWNFGPDNIAKIDQNRIFGMNLGKTKIEGKYRNHLISFDISVIEPMEGMTKIVQKYERGHKVSLFGGNFNRGHIDGSLENEAEFVSPGSVDMTNEGTIYISDSGILRKIKNGTVETVNIEPFYITPNIVRCDKKDVYILTNEWEDTGKNYKYGIFKLENGGITEEIYISEANYTKIEDFGFSKNENDFMYFIEHNSILSKTYLKKLNLRDINDIYTICELPEGTSSLTLGNDDEIYLSNPQMGTIMCYKNGDLKYFAGMENEKAFVDGNAPLFYMPQKIKYADNVLYIWDFNVLRKITEGYCVTIAGEASSDFDFENIKKEYEAENIVFTNNFYTDFTVAEKDNILLCDPKRSIIWKIN